MMCFTKQNRSEEGRFGKGGRDRDPKWCEPQVIEFLFYFVLDLIKLVYLCSVLAHNFIIVLCLMYFPEYTLLCLLKIIEILPLGG